jgi:F0F1-type ATP synthase assembly protein I
MAQTRIQTKPRQIDLSHVLVIGAWGFAIVIASMLFLYVGHMIDEMLNTPPTFMLGLFFLGLALCIGRLYKDAWDRIPKRNKVQG